jgi:hypothetical protein
VLRVRQTALNRANRLALLVIRFTYTFGAFIWVDVERVCTNIRSISDGLIWTYWFTRTTVDAKIRNNPG